MNDTNASSGPRMAVPNAKGITDAVEYLKQSSESGNYVLITPQGLVFESKDPKIILLAISRAMLGGEFDTSHLGISNNEQATASKSY